MNVASPPAPTIPIPKIFAPSKNVTVPVMVPAVVEGTAALKMTLTPTTAGLGEALSEVEVVGAAAAFTVCASTADVLARSSYPLRIAR
jgi:hypothetical protein